MSEAVERRRVSVKEFAAYLGVSDDVVYRPAHSDPDVQRVTRKLGGRLIVCLAAWQDGVESAMGERPSVRR